LNHCPVLVSLIASRNRLTELPTHFGSVMLREIWLNGNSIKCLACNAWLPNLQRFYLQDNLIDNLESLLGCPSLEVIVLPHVLLLLIL
jgi:Leucine-rich repeat (LRR) protein